MPMTCTRCLCGNDRLPVGTRDGFYCMRGDTHGVAHAHEYSAHNTNNAKRQREVRINRSDIRYSASATPRRSVRDQGLTHRIRKCIRLVVRWYMVKLIGSRSNLKKMPGTPLPCSTIFV